MALGADGTGPLHLVAAATDGVGPKTPTKLVNRIGLVRVAFEGHTAKRLAVRLHDVPAEVEGKDGEVAHFAQVLQHVLAANAGSPSA